MVVPVPGPGRALRVCGGGARVCPPPPPGAPPPVTHALHVRFGSTAAAAAFLAHPAVAGAVAGAAASAAADTGVLLFGGRVPSPSLESLFRRGPEWEAGVERVFVLAQVEGADGGAADAWLADVATLAESSVAGALQATAGRLAVPGIPAGATHALMTRFAGPAGLAAFLGLPAVAALAAGGGRGGRAAAARVGSDI